MEEAEYLCDEIAIINKGKITATDTPDGLKQRYGGVKTVDIEAKGFDNTIGHAHNPTDS